MMGGDMKAETRGVSLFRVGVALRWVGHVWVALLCCWALPRVRSRIGLPLRCVGLPTTTGAPRLSATSRVAVSMEVTAW